MYLSLKEELKNRCVHVLNKTSNQTASRRGRATTVKKSTNTPDARAKLLLCYSKAIAFLSFSSLTSLIKLLDEEKQSKRRETNHKTVEPRYNEPLYNDVLGITNAIFCHSNGEIHEKEPR